MLFVAVKLQKKNERSLVHLCFRFYFVFFNNSFAILPSKFFIFVKEMNINEATRQFIEEHADDDVRQLALQGSRDKEVDMGLALQQIQGQQTARRKLPSWAAVSGILYPTHLSMEQCSSEQTARYKAQVLCDLPAKKRIVDLTGGFGVDFAFMSEAYTEAVYIEQLPELYAIATHNFSLLKLHPALKTLCADGVEYLHQMDHASLIFLDPARRDGHGGRTYGISDCTPNVLPLLDELLSKGNHVMLKLSPMLDWRKAVSDVGHEHVEQIHIVSVSNECKELLLLLSARGCTTPRLYCINDEQLESFDLLTSSSSIPSEGAEIGHFLYEPNASLMKAGLFDELAQRYDVTPLAKNSHLFTSEERIATFPGRIFQITTVSSMNKQELRTKILPLQRANISVRNFPMSVADLRKRLKLSEGGSNYLFATTLTNGEHVLIVCQHL